MMSKAKQGLQVIEDQRDPRLALRPGRPWCRGRVPGVVLRHPFRLHRFGGERQHQGRLALETVEVGRMAQNDTWYTATAPRATRAQGEAGVAIILDHLKTLLGL